MMQVLAVAIGHDAFAVLCPTQTVHGSGHASIVRQQCLTWPRQQHVFIVLVGLILTKAVARGFAGDELVQSRGNVAIGSGAGVEGF